MHRFSTVLLLTFAAVLGAGPGAYAAEDGDRDREPVVREMFVPFEDLNVLLQDQPRRVLLSREEYAALLKKAKKSPETRAPHSALLVSADYTASIGQQRAQLAGKLAVDVLEDGLHAVPLDIGGVGLKSAKLDGRNAATGRDDKGRLMLLVEGTGRHELLLEMVAPLETTAARQVVHFRLACPPAARLHLTVPGDVELKSGAEVVSRVVDAAAAVTRFELLPRGGDTTLVMSLNSRLQRREALVVARSVLIDEVTQAYEKLHAAVSLGILHRAVGHFRFVVPDGFEITEISSPLLARWDIEDEGDRKLLNVHLRQQTTETVLLNLSAIKTPNQLQQWSFPKLEPLDVVGQVAVVGLLVEQRLNAESIAAEGLIPIDTDVLSRAVPETILHPEPGTPPLRPVVAYYAPQREFNLTAGFAKPQAELAVRTSLLLTLAENGHEMLGGLAMVPDVEKQFEFEITVPPGWHVAGVTRADEKPLDFERYGAADEQARIRVRVPEGIPVGKEFQVNFHATHAPPGWLAGWEEQRVKFPAFAVAGATSDVGAIAVEVRDDLTVRPDTPPKLTSLDEPEKQQYGLAGVATNLAYRYESPEYELTLLVERTRPRLTARTFSFITVKPDALVARYEVAYNVEEARTRRLALLLPAETTPETLSIEGLDGVKLKQDDGELEGDMRRWTVLLEEARRGTIRLGVDFQQPLPVQQLKTALALPIVAAGGVDYQSGLVAVEGTAELDVRVKTEARRADVGELVDAEYQPGRRLLGVYGFVGDPVEVKVDVFSRGGYRLHPAIVELATLSTHLSSGGESLTQARFALRTKALFLEVELPKDSELWSARLDDKPIKPQREGRSLLVSLPAGAADARRNLQIIYATPVRAVTLRKTLSMPAPKLRLRADGGAEPSEVPLNDLVWRLHLPSGYEVVRTGGTVVTDQVLSQKPELAAVSVARKLYEWSGKVNPFWGATMAAREAARRSVQEAYDMREVPYYPRDYTGPEEVTAILEEEHKAMDLAGKGPAEKKIVEALNSPTQLDFTEVPLQDVVEYLKDYHGIEIQIDQRSLDDVGIGTDTPITKNLKGISLRSALRLVLRDLDLTYQIQDEVLMITTPEEAESRLTTKVYPVGDLVVFRDESGKLWTDYDTLIEIIGSTVQPTTWDEVGGPASISGTTMNNANVLVLSQTEDVHEEIAELLANIRKVSATKKGDGRPPLKARPKPGEQRGKGTAMGGGMGGMGMGFGQAGAAKPGAGATDEGRPADGEPEEEPPLAETAAGETAAPTPTPPPQADLKGVRSLDIDLERGTVRTSNVVTFRSLGVEPELVVTLADRSRYGAMAWGLALAVGLAGVAITNRTVATKVRYLVIVALAATVGPLVYDCVEASRVCNMVFYAAAWLVPYYLLIVVVKRLGRPLRRVLSFFGLATAATAAILMSACTVPTLEAAPPKPEAGPYVIQVVEPPEPVKVPPHAIILPYDPESKTGIQDADKLLVPYAEYVQLWNRAYPDKKIETRKVPAPYAFAGASYSTMLEGDEYLLVSGELEIDVYADGYVTIPLGLGGGVLARAELDGRPARLKVARPAQGGNAPNAPAGQPAAQDSPPGDSPGAKYGQDPFRAPAAPPNAGENPFGAQAAPLVVRPPNRPNDSLIVLYASGKGRHRLELAVRLRLSREGGWRVAEGVLPSALASALSIIVPEPETELQLDRLADRGSYETAEADESIDTALGPGGAVSIRWRPKVGEGQVDRSLTAQSTAVLDVQEDGLRLVWKLVLKFPRSQQEQFSINVPADYRVEKVEGGNVRGWERDEQDRRTVDVTLLKAAKEQETITLHLWRPGAVGQGDLAEFDVPVVELSAAALHNGRVTIRRSPLLDVRTVSSAGVTRADLGGEAAEVAGGPQSEKSPLGIRPYQAYGFVTTPFSLRVKAAELAPETTATVQTVLKIAEYERSLESQVTFRVQGCPVHRLEMFLPRELTLEQVVAPGEFQWALTKTEEDERELLTIYLGAGQQGEVPVLVRGRLGRLGALEQFPLQLSLPRLEVRNVNRQQGDIAVQADPAFEIEANEKDLQNCKKVLRKRLYGWLKPQQQRATRLALQYAGGDYGGTLQVSLAPADVTCDTITNVRVTDRVVEETILLDFSIRNAGIRELSFLLPERMKDCRINVPKLRRKTITDTGKGERRVWLELQDEVMDELRVLVENDRLLTPQVTAAIPTVEKCRTGRQYVALESAGRSEVVVDRLQGLDPLARQQKEWDKLKGILGGDITQAYLVDPAAQEPQLVFKTKYREAVETAGARIGLAETNLVLDTNGAYRAQQIYHLDNSTEQFLQIQLPEGAELWTARVAGEPVKPVQIKGLVHIPLIKTAPGELDYQVVLMYGGKGPAPGALGSVDFPLMRTENVKPALSQVRLFVPKTHRWFDFGGTMRLVTEEDDLTAGYVSYQTQHAERLMQTVRGESDFAKVRAASNLKQIGLAMEQFQSSLDSYAPNVKLQAELTVNAGVLREADEEVGRLQLGAEQEDSRDNRDRLNYLFEDQKTTRSRNVVQDLGGNWADVIEQEPGEPAGGVKFNDRWLDSNKLYNPVLQEEPDKKDAAERPSAGKAVVGWGSWRGEKPQPAEQKQPQAPQVAQGKLRSDLLSRQMTGGMQGRGQVGDTDRDTVIRYQEKLQQQAEQQQEGILVGDTFAIHERRDQRGAVTQHGEIVSADGQMPSSAVQFHLGGPSGQIAAGAEAVPGGPPATGLASLELQLPIRDDFYEVYRFTTPRGKGEITARVASHNLLTNLGHLGVVLAIIAAVAYLVRLGRSGRLAWLGQPAGSWLLICIGLLALICGFLPVAGAVVVVAGIVLKIHRGIARRRFANQPVVAEVVQG